MLEMLSPKYHSKIYGLGVFTLRNKWRPTTSLNLLRSVSMKSNGEVIDSQPCACFCTYKSESVYLYSIQVTNYKSECIKPLCYINVIKGKGKLLYGPLLIVRLVVGSLLRHL